MARRSRTKTKTKTKRQSRSSDDSDYEEDCRPRKRTKSRLVTVKGKETVEPDLSDSDITVREGVAQHPKSLHDIHHVREVREALLRWFAGVHGIREMPWRKQFDPNMSPKERNQRAYEVWVSEVMLQQTQVATVIPYYKRWMEKFPTLEDLAASDIEHVNALWKGLGYYSRASRLLAGAQKVVKTLKGRLPDDAKEMQDKVPGIGRYSAGAICSIAYGERVPVLDGNVHRLLSRFLAVHAPPKAKATLDLLWNAATEFVRLDENLPTPESEAKDDPASEMARTQYPGDINQALIELGSTVCRVQDPRCSTCPIRNWCCAYKLTNDQTDENGLVDGVCDVEDLCTLCVPMPRESVENAVVAYPMKGNRKKAREELDIVNVIEWRLSSSHEERWFLLVRRPENGLLAGLYEFPTTANVSISISSAALLKQTNDLLSKYIETGLQPFNARKKKREDLDFRKTYRVEDIIPAGDIVHIFSHIRKTYRVQWVILEGGQGPPKLSTELNAKNAEPPDSAAMITRGGRWYHLDEVSGANIGSGVIKVWNLVKKKWEKTSTS